MATFLSNLPSFNKDNFSNFQPDLNKCQPRRQAFNLCNKEYPDEQIIVNQQCNIIIQYLEKQSSQYQFILSNEKAKKREIDDVMTDSKFGKLDQHDDHQQQDDSSSKSSSLIKKRRFDPVSSRADEPAISMHSTAASNSNVNSNSSNDAINVNINDEMLDEYIEVDDTSSSSNTTISNNNSNNNNSSYGPIDL